MAKKPHTEKKSPVPKEEDKEIAKNEPEVEEGEAESLIEGATDLDLQQGQVAKASPQKVAKAKEVLKTKADVDETANEPSTYHGIPLTPEEAAAHDPAKHIVAEQLTREETEAEDEPEPVRKGHITTDEEHLELKLRKPDTGVKKAKVGQQAPLQFANHKADEHDDRASRVAAEVSEGVRKAVKNKV
jgi:hypothetical protein